MKDRLTLRRNRLSEREANSNKKEEGFKATMEMIQHRSAVKSNMKKNDEELEELRKYGKVVI